MSKRKHTSQSSDGGQSSGLFAEEELLKLTKAKSIQEAEIKNVRNTIAKLSTDKDALA